MDDLRGLFSSRRGRPPTGCAWCAVDGIVTQAEVIVELRASAAERPLGAVRGEYLGTRSRRLCKRHALLLMTTFERGPKPRARAE